MSRAECIVRSVLLPLAVYFVIGLLGTAAENAYSIPGELIEKAVTLLYCAGLILRDRQYFPEQKKKLPARFHLFVILAGLAGSVGFSCLSAAAGLSGGAASSIPAISSAVRGSECPAGWILAAVTLAAVSPAAEEFLFRGLVFNGIRRCIRFLPAAVLSSLIFAVFHGNIAQGFYGFAMGLAYAAVYEKSGSLAAPVEMHMAANAVSVAAMAVPGIAAVTGRVPALFAAAGLAGWFLSCAAAVRIGNHAGFSKSGTRESE